MLKPHIAIIDDGINEEFYKIGKLNRNIHITSELDVYERGEYDPFMPSHGTTCAAIVKKYAPEAVLSSVKILNDESHRGMKDQLIKALKWCADNGMQLVNLSLGTIDYRDFVAVEKAVNYAAEKGVVIVAACNNRNIFTCPASLENVIGVNCDISEKLKERDYIYNSISLEGIDITACGRHNLKKYSGESNVTSACNSFAAPMITALVYYIIKSNSAISLQKVKEILQEKSLKYADAKSSGIVYNDMALCRDIPMLKVYNYPGEKENEFCKKLTDMFREDGYNAVVIYMDDMEKDICNGRINIKDYIKRERKSFKEVVQMISNVYDPDILIVTIDILKDSKHSHFEDAKSYKDVDIEIHLYDFYNIEVINDFKTKIFDFKNQQMNGIYRYILNLFDTV